MEIALEFERMRQELEKERQLSRYLREELSQVTHSRKSVFASSPPGSSKDRSEVSGIPTVVWASLQRSLRTLQDQLASTAAENVVLRDLFQQQQQQQQLSSSQQDIVLAERCLSLELQLDHIRMLWQHQSTQAQELQERLLSLSLAVRSSWEPQTPASLNTASPRVPAAATAAYAGAEGASAACAEGAAAGASVDDRDRDMRQNPYLPRPPTFKRALDVRLHDCLFHCCLQG